MLVLKICIGTWKNASRDQRELAVCRELGAETVVLAKGNADDKGREEIVDSVRVQRYSTRPYLRLPVIVNRVASIFQWAKYAGTLNADIISGHDLGGWVIGWLSRLYTSKKKPALVYDSHEFELGRNTKRNRFQLAGTKLLERFALKHSAFTIVVNDSIADELVKIYALTERPIVARNIPNRIKVDLGVCSEIRKELDRRFGAKGFVLIYHGAICRNRGIEQLLIAVRDMQDVMLLLLGNPESDTYLNDLQKHYIESMGDRVFVKQAVPHDELWKYVGAADLCVAPIIPSCRSYYFALPNKLFEAVQAGTPILASDLPEMRRIVDQYGIGECVEVADSVKIRQKLLEMKDKGKTHYSPGLARAQEELNWDIEKKAVKSAYRSLFSRIAGE